MALAIVLAGLAGSCGSGGGGGGSGTENPTNPPANDASSGLLLEVDEFRPALPSVTNIGQTLHAGISLASDHRAEGMTFQWSLNGTPLSGDAETIELDCSGLVQGTHSLELTVFSGDLSTAFYWSVQATGDSIKNRAPVLLQALPAGAPTVARGEKVRFVAVAEDVDAADSLQYAWSVDSKKQGVAAPAFEVDTSSLSPGKHTVMVAVTDGNEHPGTDAPNHTWTLRVGESGDATEPFISSAWPAGNPRMHPRGKLRLEVAVAGTSGARPTCRWDVDGVLQPTSEVYLDFNPSAEESGVLSGAHQVSCTLVSSEELVVLSASRVSWTITLDPPEIVASPAGAPEENRLPVVTALYPADSSGLPQANSTTFRVEAMDGDGDILTYRWLVDGVLVEGAGPAYTYSADPELGQVHTTIEVLSSDGRSSDASTDSPTWYSLGKWSLAALPLEGAPLTISSGASILDNGQSGTAAKGTWLPSGATQAYGADSLYSKRAGDTYQYNLKVPAAGSYDVLMWWTAWANRSSAVPVTITYAGGSAKVTVNQLTSGGQWNLLGTFQFSSSAKITITAAPGGYSTCADAVCLNPHTGSPPDPSALDPAPEGIEFTIDDGSPGTSSEGYWAVSSGRNSYGGRSLYTSSTGTYSFFRPLSAAGTYDVHVWWTSVNTRDSQAPYEITHAGGTATATRDQRTGGGQWQYLGRYDFTTGVRVTVKGRGAGTVCADAARFVPAPGSNEPPGTDPDDPLPEAIMDDGSSGTSSQGYWPVSTAKNAYGGRSLYNSATGTYSYTWELPVPATYDVYAWWTAVSNRDSQAPYDIVHDQGTTTVTKDQRTGGGQWQILGRFGFGSQAQVTLRGRGAGTVCADAVRFVLAPVLPPEPEPGPDVEVTPLSLAFGDVVVGSSKTLSFTVKNTGAAVLQLSSIALGSGTGPEFAVVSGAAIGQLSPGASAAVSVAYSPQATASSAGAAVVKSNDTDESSVAVSLTGRGIPAGAPEVDVSPVSLSFGELIPGGSKNLSVTVRNLGAASLSVSSIGLGSGTSAAFSIASGPSAVNLSPGQSTSITVKYAPSAEGTDQGSLVILSSDADEPRVTVSLTGSSAEPDPTGRSVTLAWDAPTTNADGTPLTDLKGFKVYWGKASHSYTSSGDAQGSTEFTTPVLAPGTYYFAVTAYDQAGNESGRSTEISTVIQQ